MDNNEFPGKGKHVTILGVPLGYGAAKMGSELGVDAMRLSRIRDKQLHEHLADLGYNVNDAGNAEIIKPEKLADPEDKTKYLKEILASFANVSTALKAILATGSIPIILGGDHSINSGTFSAIASHFREQGEEIGLVWFDAHADINTPETTMSGNIHGMPMAAILGRGAAELVNLEGYSPKIKPEYLAHIGGRDFDPAERRAVHELGLRDNFFTMSDIDRRGMMACVTDAIAIASKAPGGYAVTFDVDVLDPRFAPGSGTLVRGGITYREAHLGLEAIAEHGGMRSFEIVEVNPLLDRSNITVSLACELILSAFGKTIL
ncbi:MAG: arginase [Acidobacteria bacterium]|nr:arginase [Acidobacteriota bacterium]